MKVTAEMKEVERSRMQKSLQLTHEYLADYQGQHVFKVRISNVTILLPFIPMRTRAPGYIEQTGKAELY